MNEQQINNFYASRLPVSSKLADYALSIGQNNRVLNWKVYRGQNPAGPTLFNPNRVALLFASECPHNAAGVGALVRCFDKSGNIIFSHTIVTQPADIAAVALGTTTYNPWYIDVTMVGPMIYESWDITASNVVTNNIIELTMVPKCCDYLGVMGSGSLEQQGWSTGNK